jgi:hypothetical protein
MPSFIVRLMGQKAKDKRRASSSRIPIAPTTDPTNGLFFAKPECPAPGRRAVHLKSYNARVMPIYLAAVRRSVPLFALPRITGLSCAPVGLGNQYQFGASLKLERDIRQSQLWSKKRRCGRFPILARNRHTNCRS